MSNIPTKVDSFGKQYGPYAFGVISLLIIWFGIVRPELAQQRIEFNAIKDVANTNESTAIRLENTAKILDTTVEKLKSFK